MTKLKLELIRDPEMCLFFEKGIRDGVYFISKRYSKCNNKYLESKDNNENTLYT